MNAGPKKTLAVFSWALYDFSNAIFGMNILAFSLTLYLTVEKGVQDIVYGLTLGISMVLAGVSMPLFGAISDRSGRRMPFLIFFTLLCVIFLVFMGMTDNAKLTLILFCISNFGYLLSGAVFYNALLPHVADRDEVGRISGYGVSLSYVGTIIGLLIIRPYALRHGYQATFIPTALFFLIFALPCFIFVKDKKMPAPRKGLGEFIKESFGNIRRTIHEVKNSQRLLSFFLGIFLIVNATNAVFIFMSAYLKKVFYFFDAEILVLYIVSTLFSVAGSLSLGFVTDRIGARTIFIASISTCCAALFISIFSLGKSIFWVTGPMVGLAFGGVRVSGRALAVELFAKERMGEIFGLLGFLSNLAFMGVLGWGVAVFLFGPFGIIKYRIALFILAMMLISGALILRNISTERSRA